MCIYNIHIEKVYVIILSTGLNIKHQTINGYIVLIKEV
jgi:hypothetical protein